MGGMSAQEPSAQPAEPQQNNQPADHKPVQINMQDLLEAVQSLGKKTVQQQDEAAAKAAQYDEAILDSSAIEPTDSEGNPIPVTIPIVLAPNITVVYTTRLGGASTDEWAHFNLGGKSGDMPDHVRANRDALANELHAKLSLINQVHSGDAIDIDARFEPNRSFGFDASGTQEAAPVDDVESVDGTVQIIEGDAQVSTQTGIALGVFAADCLPVLLADPVSGVIAAAHCGRKGLMEGVIGSTVEMMKAKGADPAHILATLGPAICGDCYETGDEIADAFDAKFPGTFTLTRFGGPGIDINKAALMALEQAGVSASHIYSAARQRRHTVPRAGRRTRAAVPRGQRGRSTARRAHQAYSPQHVHARKPAVVLAPPRPARAQGPRRPHARADRAPLTHMFIELSKESQ